MRVALTREIRFVNRETGERRTVSPFMLYLGLLMFPSAPLAIYGVIGHAAVLFIPNFLHYLGSLLGWSSEAWRTFRWAHFAITVIYLAWGSRLVVCGYLKRNFVPFDEITRSHIESFGCSMPVPPPPSTPTPAKDGEGR